VEVPGAGQGGGAGEECRGGRACRGAGPVHGPRSTTAAEHRSEERTAAVLRVTGWPADRGRYGMRSAGLSPAYAGGRGQKPPKKVPSAITTIRASTGMATATTAMSL